MKKEEKKVESKVAEPKYAAINLIIGISLFCVGSLIGALVYELDSKPVTVPSETCGIVEIVDDSQNTDGGDNNSDVQVSVEYYNGITKLTNLPDDYFKNNDTYVEFDGMHAYILNGVVYFEGYEMDDLNMNTQTTLFKANDIKDPIKIRIFNETGVSGASPAFHVVTKDGKLYEIAAFSMSKQFKIEQIYSEYKISDIVHKDTHGCDEEDAGHCGHIDLILQDGSKKVIWY